jgi:enolase
MKAIHIVQLRWLNGIMDQLGPEDFDVVSELLNKQFDDVKLLTDADFITVERIFKKYRYEGAQESMVS